MSIKGQQEQSLNNAADVSHLSPTKCKVKATTEDEKKIQLLFKVKQIFQSHSNQYLTESDFIKVTEACQLPTYMNIAFFQCALSFTNHATSSEPSSKTVATVTTATTTAAKGGKDESHKQQEQSIPTAKGGADNTAVTVGARVITYATFERCWSHSLNTYHTNDEERFFFTILLLQRKKEKSSINYLVPEDFLAVLEDIIFNHPALQFLVDNPTFQEKYIETAICRLFYDAKCPLGRMNLAHFRRCKFTSMIKRLTPEVDLNTTNDCFSYKHFYVLYCKFWMLDDDHDMLISEMDLQTNYNDGVLPTKLITQIMQNGKIPAFRRAGQKPQSIQKVLQYFDFIWFFLSDIDKSTPVAIEYWFRCMDSDGDGMITTFDLQEYWMEQDKRLRAALMDHLSEEHIQFDDLIRQMNDLIQPKTPGQFCLSDLKRNGMIAERFFDTFLNVDRFQIHDSSQGLIRNSIIAEKEKRRRQMQQFQSPSPQLISVQHNGLAEVALCPQSSNSSENHIICEHVTEQRQQPMLETFTLGSWSDYAEIEYELLVADEDQYDSTTDDNHLYRDVGGTIVPINQTNGGVEADNEEEEDDEEEDDEDVYCYYQHYTSNVEPRSLSKLVLLEHPILSTAYKTEMEPSATGVPSDLKQGTYSKDSTDTRHETTTTKSYNKIWLSLEDDLDSSKSVKNGSNGNDSDGSLLKGLIWPTVKEL